MHVWTRSTAVSADAGATDSALRTFANLLEIPALPGWAIAALTLPPDLRQTALVSWAANGASWALWVTALLSLNAARVRLARRRDEAAALAPAAHAANTVDLSRRRFAVNGGVAVLGLGGAGTMVGATMIEPWLLAVRRYRVPIRDLPPGLDGLCIVHVSDTHLGARVPAALIRDAVAQAAALRPDLVLLTGDYIHRHRSEIDPAADLLAPLVASASIGAVAVLGNHDWYGDGAAMSAALASRGVRMLDNRRLFLCAESRRLLTDERPGAVLCLAGVGDLEEHTVDFDAALAGVSPSTPRLLLAHNPDTAEHARLQTTAPPRVDMMLSGHTHGGQVSLPLVGPLVVPSAYGPKYAGGLVRGPACPVLVSRGVGMSILPIRVNCPPEIGEITLLRG